MTKDLVARERTPTKILHAYTEYLLVNGSEKQKAEFFKDLKLKLQLHDRKLIKVV